MLRGCQSPGQYVSDIQYPFSLARRIPGGRPTGFMIAAF
jgi:hypothetical protein